MSKRVRVGIRLKLDLADKDSETRLTVREIVLEVFFRIPEDGAWLTTHELGSQDLKRTRGLCCDSKGAIAKGKGNF